MKVFLDDERQAPDGWVRCYWPDEVIELLYSGDVTEISLDHDLGDDDRGTGYDVLLWIEEAVATRGWTPPKISIHSANSSARQKMGAAARQIEKLLVARNDRSRHKKHGNFLTSSHMPAWFDSPAGDPVRLEESDGILFFNFFEFGNRMVLGVEHSWKNFREEFLVEGWRRPLVPEPMAIWDTQSGQRVSFLQGHHIGDVRGAELLEDGRLITWGRDYVIRVWDLVTGFCTDVLPLPLWPHPADRRAVLSCDMFAKMKPSEKQRYVNNSHLPSPDVRIDWIVNPGGKQHSFQCASRSEKEQNIVKPWTPKTDEHASHRIWDLQGAEGGYSTWLTMNDGRLLGGGTSYGTTGQFYAWDRMYNLQILFVGRPDCNLHLIGEVSPGIVLMESASRLNYDDQYRFQL